MNENALELRKKYLFTRPAVMTQGPIIGLGYRPPWRLGNVCQARFAARHGLHVMLAQQSAREIERTGRSFQDVIDSATISAHRAGLRLPWGADGDHLRNEKEVTAAARACHVTQPTVSMQLKDLAEAVGMPLYEQIGKRLYLTAAGENLAQTARSMVDEWAAFEQRITAAGNYRITAAGTLRVVPRS